MSFPALLLLLGATGLTILAAAVATLRLRVTRTSERLLAVVVLGHLFVLAPVYAFGALSMLTSWSATLGTLAIDVLALVVAVRGRRLMDGVAELAQASRDLRADLAWFMSPATGRMRLAGALMLGVVALILWLALTCYFAPSFRGYDAPWYHEPIAAFAIQERGLHVPQLPQRLFYVGSLARGSELMSAWLVLITGSRALIELPSVLGFAALWLGTYRLARVVRAGKERALGWATVVVLTPGLLAYAQSTYVDLHACAMITTTACFALTRPASVGSALLALVAACLAVSMKLYALGPAALLTVVALLRAWHAEKAGVCQVRTSFEGAGLLVLIAMGIALATPIRNALVYGNPVYPLSVTLPFLDRALSGPINTTARDLEMTPPLVEFLRFVFQPLASYQIEFAHYVEVHSPIEIAPTFNYGYAMPIFGLGLAVLALVSLTWETLRVTANDAHRTKSLHYKMALARLATAAVVALAIAVFFFFFPITRLARYLGFVLACLGALAATALMGRRSRRVGDALLIAAIVVQLGLTINQDPRLLYSPREIWQLALMPPSERELAGAYGAFASANAARFRDQVMTAETIVLFGDDVLEPGPLWNSSMSNRVEYLPEKGDPTDYADSRGATLVACTRGSARCMAVERRSNAWMFIGELYPKIISQECLIFRRVGSSPKSVP